MDRVLTTFIHALRNADVRVSPAETLDAMAAVDLIGYSDRALLKHGLALVLSKTEDEKIVFDDCFERFFANRGSALQPAELIEAAREAADSTGQAGNHGSGRGASGKRNTEPTEPADLSSAQSSLGQLLARAMQTEIAAAISAAGQRVNVHQIEVFTQKGVYTRRVLEAMGLLELQAEIHQLNQSALTADRNLGRDLSRRRDWLRQRVRDFVEQQFLLHADVTGRRLREDLLRDMRLGAIDQRHRQVARNMVLRMARRLVAACSRRKKVFDRGSLHVPRTLRRNMKYDDAIFDLHWKSLQVDRPKVMAICDVSGSVASYAGFMLMFLYSLDEVLPKVRSFAFSADLAEVTALFARNEMEAAMALTLKHYGGGATDYGRALVRFRGLCLDEVDKRTTVIVLGDARNNYGDTRLDILREIHDRCRRLIWLNPESRVSWNTGDSEMRHYASACHQVEECGTLAQLERVVARLIRP